MSLLLLSASCGHEFARILTKKIKVYAVYIQCVTSQKLTRGEKCVTMRSYNYPAEEITEMVLDFPHFVFTVSCLLSSYIGFWFGLGDFFLCR